MSKLIKKQNNLRKAQSRFDKVSKRDRQFQIQFERAENSKGRFKTKANIIRGEKVHHGNNRGIIHKFVNLKYRVNGDAPSVTRVINSAQPTTFKGKVIKKTAQTVNFVVHDAGKTAVDTALAAETVTVKSSDIVQRETRNKLKQKYTREAVDDYHRGVFFVGKTAVDAVKGTHQQFKLRKQAKLLLLVFAFILMIFSSISSGGGFVLGTYNAQDYDLSEAEKYYTQLAWDMNQKILKVSDQNTWKTGLSELGADTSSMKDKPSEWKWGASSEYGWNPVYDFDNVKLDDNETSE